MLISPISASGFRNSSRHCFLANRELGFAQDRSLRFAIGKFQNNFCHFPKMQNVDIFDF